MIYTIYNKLFSVCSNFSCPVCNKKVGKFIPLPVFYAVQTKKYGYLYTFDDAETLNYNAYSCPHCNASDRDRLYALYLTKRLLEQDTTKNIAILEIAPSRPLTEMLKKSAQITLRTADLMMDSVDDNINITDMKCYKEEAFDAFICSHVLEHVPDDIKALRELFRILKSGGWGILMVPIILTIDQIDEDPLLEDIGERWRRFGQGDHVRMYSRKGFVERVEGAGFIVKQYGQNYFGVDAFKKHGISEKSILYIVEKI